MGKLTMYYATRDQDDNLEMKNSSDTSSYVLPVQPLRVIITDPFAFLMLTVFQLRPVLRQLVLSRVQHQTELHYTGSRMWPVFNIWKNMVCTPSQRRATLVAHTE